jgi:uncharacterized protein
VGIADVGYLKFSVGKNYYVYDTTTNDLVKIDRSVYLILNDYFKCDLQTLKQKYQNNLSPKELHFAISFIDRVQNEYNMFQPFFQKSFSEYLDRPYLRATLEENSRRLMLNVTEQCNQRCTYCFYSGNYAGRRTHQNHSMSWDVAKRSMDYFFTHSGKVKNPAIGFFGGEPLLNWTLVKMCIDYINTRKTTKRPSIYIATNGLLLNDPIIDYLIQNNVILCISLDGPAHIHDTSRVLPNGKGTFQKIIQVLNNIYKKAPHYLANHVSINCTYDLNNNLFEVFKYFSNNFFRNIQVRTRTIRDFDTNVYSFTRASQRQFQKGLDELINLYLKSFTNSKKLNYSVLYHLLIRVFQVLPKRKIGLTDPFERPNKTCIPGVSQLFVSTEGSFYTCDNFCPTGYEIGHYQTGINVEKVYQLLEKYIHFCEDMCQTCWAYRLCSLCFVHTLKKGHMSKKRKQEHCIRERKQIKMDLKRYAYIWENEPKEAIYNKYSLHSRAAQHHVKIKHKIPENIQIPIRLKPLSADLRIGKEELQKITEPDSISNCNLSSWQYVGNLRFFNSAGL